jgi:hypothetical protein
VRVLSRAAFFQSLGDDQADLLIGDRLQPPAAHLKALQPRATNRDRYMVTVGRDTPSAAATCRFGVPSAHTQHNPRPQRQRLRRLAPARLRAGLLWRWPAYYSVKTAVGLVLLAGGRTAFALLGYS